MKEEQVEADLVQLDMLLKEAIAKLSAGFIGAHQALERQRALCASDECAALAAQACTHLDDALTALQFEDIASQLIGGVRKCLSEGTDRTVADRNLSVPQHHMESGDVELF